ncbi:MAG TPA: tail fiber protein [Chthoniobacterales bacterium]|nr:tail fiber protein [Chthoniobacterales bacterium]
MGQPFLGEIKIVSFNFAPKNWAMCNGQFLPINQNQALFSLLGTMYGGNGQTTFALPDLRGQVPIHVGGKFTLGQAGGEPAHTLTMSEMPQHIHLAQATNTNGSVALPSGNFLGAFNNGYTQPAALTSLNPGTIGNVGGSQPHEDRQPYLVLTFCIALIGIFPSRN